jgi:hypothetical protein
LILEFLVANKQEFTLAKVVLLHRAAPVPAVLAQAGTGAFDAGLAQARPFPAMRMKIIIFMT